jgi:RNA polymerase sigma-70 factor (ECF subfamily)
VRSVEIDPPSPLLARAELDAFYDRALPAVFGYLVRLSGGDRDRAWDLTQDTWMVIVERIIGGRSQAATIPYAISIARTKYIDSWRREARLQEKLQLIWSGGRDTDKDALSSSDVLEHLSECSPTSRLVLMLAYVEEVPVAQIAAEIGKPVSSTYSILARARAELRDRLNGVSND